MKVVLASSFVPFIKGGATAIVEWLEAKLVEHGHQVESVFLPFVERPETMMDQLLSYRMLNMTESCDRLIAFRPPAYLLRHPSKFLWFIHHFRAYYDLWGTQYCGLEDNAKNRAFRQRIFATDEVGLSESARIFTNSKIVSNRLKTFNSIDSEVLYPPVFQSERFHCEPYDPVIVCICRLEDHKRQHLLVDAMRYTKSKAKLVLAGASHSGSYPRKLKLKVLKYCLSNKVKILDRWISEEEKSQLLATCCAAAYLPFDEDSYGYPSLEAQHACKAVLTTNDSGGVPELVTHGVNGLIVDPNPKAIAEAIDQLVTNPQKTREMGQNGPIRINELDISWDRVIRKLTAA